MELLDPGPLYVQVVIAQKSAGVDVAKGDTIDQAFCEQPRVLQRDGAALFGPFGLQMAALAADALPANLDEIVPAQRFLDAGVERGFGGCRRPEVPPSPG